MSRVPAALLERARTDEGKKVMRYSLVSIISVVVSQVILFVLHGPLEWSAERANIAAVCVSAIPSYALNRAWTWGKRGRSHLVKEVLPFWGMALLGLIFSTWAAGFAEDHAHDVTTSELGVTLLVMAASIGAFGVLWIGKFIVLNRVLFATGPVRAGATSPDEPAPADGHS